MNKIEKLLNELCPDGVEFKELKDIFQISRWRVMSKEYLANNSWDFPVYSSQTANNWEIWAIKTYDYDWEYLTWTTDWANAWTIFYRTWKFSITNVCGLLKVKNEQELNAKFAFYCLSVNMKSFVNYGMWNPKLMSNVVEKIQIPIPPIEIQKEIVKILDTFTLLEAELEAELEARKKQYEYYRDDLLSFENDEVEWKTLDKISINLDNKRKPVTSWDRSSWKYPYYWASWIVDYVDDYIFDWDFLLISEDGANLLARNTPIAFSITGKNWVNNHAHVLQFDNYNTRRLVEIYLNSIDLSKYISGAAQPKLNQQNLNKILIPVPYKNWKPDLEKQQEIVDVLDKFDALVNDISIWLPAELKARRQQYEYYRNKLLDFKVLEK